MRLISSAALVCVAIGAAFGQQPSKEMSDAVSHANNTEGHPANSERATTILAAHTIRTLRYSLTGNQEGRVSFGDFQKQVYTHFQMDADKWVREVFVLDDGKTVGASQADHTVFWDVATGKETGRVAERVYGFSHDGRKFFTRSEDGKLWLYKYPERKRLRQIETNVGAGMDAFLFSPNDRYLAIKFTFARPEPESTYPRPHRINNNIVSISIYDLDTGANVSSWSPYTFNHNMGVFSPDSRYYDVEDTIITRYVESGVWRYDLTTRKVNKIKDYKD